MGLYGAIIVAPEQRSHRLHSGLPLANTQVEAAHGEKDFRLSQALTTTPRPATTVNTCSSSPRWIRHPQSGAAAGRCDARLHGRAQGCSLEVRPSRTIPRTT